MALLAALFVVGCGDDDKKGEGASPKVPEVKIACDQELTVDEKKSQFSKTALTCKPGTAKLTVVVPEDAKGQHGVGIDGGVYKDIEGAPVKPGRRTSLTVDLKKGKYTVYDSYKNNEKKGYKLSLTVE